MVVRPSVWFWRGLAVAAFGFGAVGLAGAADPPSTAASGPSQLPDDRLGIRTSPLLLLTRTDVRDDLKLNPQQVGDAERVIAELYSKALQLQGKRDPATIAARRAIDEAQVRWISNVLSADQRQRLEQLDLQWEGPSAVLRPPVASALALSPEQGSALARAVAERNSKRARTGFDPASERKLAEATLAILSDGQRARWEAMLGHVFRFRPTAVAAAPAAAVSPR